MRDIPILLTTLSLAAALLFPAPQARSQQAPADSTLTRAADRSGGPADLGIYLELATQFVWRGIEVSAAPTVSGGLLYDHGGIEAYALGYHSVDGEWKELDFGIDYSWERLSLGMMDIYSPSPYGEEDHFFDLSPTTGHCLELSATLTPWQRVPIRLTVATFVAGCDRHPDGRQAYSTYAELGYPFALRGDSRLQLSAGFGLNDGLYNSYDGSPFCVSHLTASLESPLHLGGATLPILAALIVSPEKEKVYLTCTLLLDSHEW